jgi:Na+/proline symporter
MNSILGFTAFVFSLLIYLVVARRAGRLKVTHPDQFFLSKKEHDGDQFAASQIAYALQMATVYPFFLFAFHGTWWLAIWNTFFFAVGIALLYGLLPRFMVKHFGLAGSPETLHAFIASIHGSLFLRQFTAWMSLIAFTGLASVEIVWGSHIIQVLFNGNSSIYYLTILILAFYLSLYLWLGGQRGTINTGQIQLVIAYVGFHAVVIWSVSQRGVSIAGLDAGIIVPIIVANGFAMLYFRIRSLRSDFHVSPQTKIFAIVTILSLLAMLLALLRLPRLLSVDSLKFSPIDTSPSEFLWQLTSFASLPLVFQFVDMTNWQRMASLTDIGNFSLLSRIRRGLLQYLIEAPLAWFLPVLLGLCAKIILANDLKGDPWDVFLSQVISTPGIIGTLLSIAIVAGIAAVFLSTADGLLSAIGYSFAYDVNKRTRTMVDRHQKKQWPQKDVDHVIGVGRSAMFAFLLVVILLFILADFRMKRGQTILDIFLAFYAPMAAMSPAILVPAITARVTRAWVAWLSIGGGAGVGLICGIISIFEGGTGIWPWLSIDASLAVAWIIYLGGIMLGGRKIAIG